MGKIFSGGGLGVVDKLTNLAGSFPMLVRLIFAILAFPLCVLVNVLIYLRVNSEMIFIPIAFLCIANHFGIWTVLLVFALQLILTVVGLPHCLWTHFVAFCVKAFQDNLLILALSVGMPCSIWRSHWPDWASRLTPGVHEADRDEAMAPPNKSYIEKWTEEYIREAFDTEGDSTEVDETEVGIFEDELFTIGYKKTQARHFVWHCQVIVSLLEGGKILLITSAGCFSLLVRLTLTILAFPLCLFATGLGYFFKNSDMFFLPLAIYIVGISSGIWTLCFVSVAQLILTFVGRPYWIWTILTGFFAKVIDDAMFILKFSLDISCCFWKWRWPDREWSLPNGLVKSRTDVLVDVLEKASSVVDEVEEQTVLNKQGSNASGSEDTRDGDAFEKGDVLCMNVELGEHKTKPHPSCVSQTTSEKPSSIVENAGETLISRECEHIITGNSDNEDKTCSISNTTEVSVNGSDTPVVFQHVATNGSKLFNMVHTSCAFFASYMIYFALSIKSYIYNVAVEKDFKPLLNVLCWFLISSFGFYIGFILAVYNSEGYYVTSLSFTEFLWFHMRSSLELNLFT